MDLESLLLPMSGCCLSSGQVDVNLPCRRNGLELHQLPDPMICKTWEWVLEIEQLPSQHRAGKPIRLGNSFPETIFYGRCGKIRSFIH
jgi:hypothetical protein